MLHSRLSVVLLQLCLCKMRYGSSFHYFLKLIYTDCKSQSSIQLRGSHGLKVPVLEVCEGKEKWGCNGQWLRVRVRMAGGDLFLRV